MSFKVKDLMIDLTAPGTIHDNCQPAVVCRVGCTLFTNVCEFQSSVPLPFTICGFNSSFSRRDACDAGGTQIRTPWTTATMHTETIQHTVPLGLQPLGSLKKYLNAALQEVDGREKTMEESLKPQSVAAVEMLEEKLSEALDELRARKTELRKKPAKQNPQTDTTGSSGR
jgi:hypothetical protein